MKFIKTTILSMMFCVSFSVSADTLTRSSVSNLLSKVQESVNARDVELLSSYLTEDAIITIEMSKKEGRILKLNKAQYKEVLKQGWAMQGKYTFEVKDIEITVSKDSKSATVTDLTIETLEYKNQTISSKSREIIEVIESKGIPLINNIYGKVEL
ncbi:MAG: nuclear transport factor 2 family protein [Agitococcus sp.]|nr:nuclear transport factor 2 family protein [Agitococcus sp.]